MEQLIHILHLEDDPADAALVQARIEAAGLVCRITRVQTGDEFGQALRQGGYDVILADFRLPMYDGMSALRLGQELYPDVPFIFVSGAMGEEAVIVGLTAGATDYVLKQNLLRLAPAIKRALHEAENRRERRQAEAELRKLSRAVEQSASTIVITDTQGYIEYVNPGFTATSGYPAAEAIGQHTRILKSGCTPPEVYQLLWETITAGKEWRGEFHNKKKNGEFYWELASISPIKNAAGLTTHFLAVKEDITENKKIETALRKLLLQLEAERERTRKQAQQLVSAQEEERRRLSRELHDEAGQALTALKISLELIQADMPENSLHQRLGAMVNLADETLERIRVLAQNLRPASLDTVGLNPTLEGFCHDFAHRTQLTIHYEGVDLPPISPEISISLYRFLQEALTNVIKHAGADTIWVLLQYDDDSISLSVEDNGKGFLHPATQNPGRIGLIGMQERIYLLGGKLDINSQPERGTRLTASIPREVKP
jgi:PAS domain S-box-containing protein